MTSEEAKIKSQLAMCCLAKKGGDALEKEKKGYSCNDSIKRIGYDFLVLEALCGWKPEGEVILSYKENCQMSFANNTMEVVSQVTDSAFFDQYDSSDSPFVAGVYFFNGDGSGTFTNAAGSVTNYTWKYENDTLTIDGTTNYGVSFDTFFTNVIFTDLNGDIQTLVFVGTPSLIGCELVNIVSEKPCLSSSQVEGMFARLNKGCACDCEDYVNILQDGETITYPNMIPSGNSGVVTPSQKTVVVRGTISGSPNFIQSPQLIGMATVVVTLDGTVVNPIQPDGTTINWTFDSLSGKIQFTYTLQNVPYSITGYSI